MDVIARTRYAPPARCAAPLTRTSSTPAGSASLRRWSARWLCALRPGCDGRFLFTMIYACFRFGVRLLALIVLGRRLHIDGMSNIPRSGPVLLIGNHAGNVEPPLTGVHIPRLDVYYMAKAELFRPRWLGWLFRRNHTFPVVRH